VRRHVVMAIRGLDMATFWHQTNSPILPTVRALVISHEDDGGPGLVGERLEGRGMALDIVQIARARDRGPHELPGLDGYDAVLSMGCTQAVFDRAAVGEWIDPELDLLRLAHRSGVPVLGICFGGQALAAALGATVERAPSPEIGWLELEVPADHGDASIDPGPWMVWHVDRFAVPAGAAELARTALCPHAFRSGRSVGLQFHPEVDAQTVIRWADDAGPAYFAAHGIDAGALLGDVHARAADAAASTVRLVDWFLDEVAGS
jgi:GMP synthase-like glutamine amidotransferase